MFGTVVAVVSLLMLVLPGFIIVDLQRGRRASTAADSDWELILRALAYSLILHIAIIWWTSDLALKLQDGDWENHISAIAVYGAVAIVLIPVIVGMALNQLLLWSERQGPLKWWHYMLGGRDARSGWDYAFQRRKEGTWLLIHLKEDDRPIAGRYGRDSWAPQSPARRDNDLWLQEVWSVGDDGRPDSMIEPRQGMWISQSDIRMVFVIDLPLAKTPQSR